MNRITTITFLVASFIAVSHGHCTGRVHNNVHPLSMNRDLSLVCSCEDFGTLAALMRALEDKECCSAGHAPSGGMSNAEDLIMNLVNALIQLTTQALSHNNCHCPNQSGNNNPGNGGSTNYHPGHNSGYLVNSNKNVLDLDLSGQRVLGAGLGDGEGISQGPNGYYNYNSRNANGDNDEGLLNVDLNSVKSNVAKGDLGKQQLIDGGGRSTPSHTSTNTSSITGASNYKPNSGEGQVNSQNNVLNVDLPGKPVDIGLGNRNDGAISDKS